MSKKTHLPIHFIAMTRHFADEDIKELLDQSPENVIKTIDLLKAREVNATKALAILRLKIENQIIKKALGRPVHKNAILGFSRR